jgi:hypothetical protein
MPTIKRCCSRSFSAALSSISSAKSRFSSVFSSSIALSRFASPGSRPPYRLYHL